MNALKKIMNKPLDEMGAIEQLIVEAVAEDGEELAARAAAIREWDALK